ncbi:MAG: hypothetical protein HKO62_05845 [Gammaproteobacteria bacterium]|nr:hypothetical protein [Gammaproteobacteria bacterium]
MMRMQSLLMRRCAARCLAAVLLGLPINALAVIYTGQWNNTSFGSLGDAQIEIIAGATEASVTVDL